MTGRTLLHYRILENLGQGGMGVVYKALDTHLDRLVAIKVLPPEKVADLERKRRFVQEAKSASALNHPNIITIYDIASEDGLDFIAMEYVPGKALSRLISRKGLALNDVLKVRNTNLRRAGGSSRGGNYPSRSQALQRDDPGRGRTAWADQGARFRLSETHR
jgi:serine/threonine protein kinase